MAVSLWAVRWDRPLTGAEYGRLLGLLPQERRQRLLRVGQPEKQQEVLWAYGLLRMALQEMYGWEQLPGMAAEAGGKPYFPQQKSVCFSISHTAGAALVGIADRPIGVDIEKIRTVSARLSAQMHAGDESEFFQSWVRREARTKRTGIGIGAMLRQEPPLDDGEYYAGLDVFPGYAAGVAAGEPLDGAEIHTIGPEALLK